MELVARVQGILRRWDPIGILPGKFGPADEYDDYATHIVSLVTQGCTATHLSQHLGKIRTRIIGVEADPESDNEIAAEILEALRNETI